MQFIVEWNSFLQKNGERTEAREALLRVSTAADGSSGLLQCTVLVVS